MMMTSKTKKNIPMEELTSSSTPLAVKRKTIGVRSSGLINDKGKKGNKKKAAKIDWTPELHRRFVHVVEQLGMNQAIPSKILEHMKVEGLTRHNVASHLQKYRIHTHKRHGLPKDDGRRLPHHIDQISRLYPCKPFVAFPQTCSNYAFPLNQQHFSVWGIPTCHHHPSGIHTWWPPHNGSYQTWPPLLGIWPWKTSPRIIDGDADAWGCPVVLQENPFSTQVHHGEEMIDQVVKEAISKPWLPLPLGLKPPSTECVLTELHRQGIHRISQSSSSCK